MGNQVSKPVGEPADDEYLKDSLDASHTKIKYSVEVLMDSDLDYQNVECNPANSSLSFHPAETSSPINKTPYEKAPKKIDKQPKLRDCCCDESKVASSPAGKQPDVNKRSQSMPQIGNVNVPEMHVSKENHGVSDIPFIDSTNSDGPDEWKSLPDPAGIMDEIQNLINRESLQPFQASAPQQLKEFHYVERAEENQQQNIDPQAVQELTQLLKKLQADIDRLLKIFDK